MKISEYQRELEDDLRAFKADLTDDDGKFLCKEDRGVFDAATRLHTLLAGLPGEKEAATEMANEDYFRNVGWNECRTEILKLLGVEE
jgi:hypothetical protein